MDTDVDIHAQTHFGDRRIGLEVEQIGASNLDIVALAVDLVLAIAQHANEGFHGDRHQARMRDPAAVIAVGRIAVLV